jgi:hypothetical protein
MREVVNKNMKIQHNTSKIKMNCGIELIINKKKLIFSPLKSQLYFFK